MYVVPLSYLGTQFTFPEFVRAVENEPHFEVTIFPEYPVLIANLTAKIFSIMQFHLVVGSIVTHILSY